MKEISRRNFTKGLIGLAGSLLLPKLSLAQEQKNVAIVFSGALGQNNPDLTDIMRYAVMGDIARKYTPNVKVIGSGWENEFSACEKDGSCAGVPCVPQLDHFDYNAVSAEAEEYLDKSKKGALILISYGRPGFPSAIGEDPDKFRTKGTSNNIERYLILPESAYEETPEEYLKSGMGDWCSLKDQKWFNVKIDPYTSDKRGETEKVANDIDRILVNILNKY